MFFKKSNEELTNKLEELFAREPDKKTDVEIFNLASQLVEENKGNYRAMYILAQCYRSGFGTAPNPQKAVELFDLLSNNPNFNSEDVEFQFKYASTLEELKDCYCLYWYLRASMNGDEYSTYNLGDLLIESNLLADIPYETRYDLAIKFFTKATFATNDKIATLAKDKIELHRVKNKIKLLEIEKQNLVVDSLKKTQ